MVWLSNDNYLSIVSKYIVVTISSGGGDNYWQKEFK